MGGRMMKRVCLWALFGLLAWAPAAPAEAQLRRVLDLNRQAMEAYNNLEIEQALSLLQEALEVARRGNVSGSPLARTYVNLGVVSIGGFGDNGQGMSYFVQALQADPNVQLDPLTSSPDIQSVFALAQRRSGGGSGRSGGSGSNDSGRAGSASSTPGTIPHHPAPEQLTNTALPIFIEAPDDAPIGNVYVYYKAPGMRDYRRMEMRRVSEGFGLELPCHEVMAPRVQYYIVAFDRDGAPMGFAGSAEDPIVVPVVSSRTQPPPALPGAPPPEQCSDEECPPGMPGCHSGGGSAGLGDTCVTTSDCRSGLTCDDNFCVAGDGGEDESDDGDMPRVFVRASFAAGFGYASSGHAADSIPVGLDTDPNAESRPENAGYVRWDDPNVDCGANDGEYCVRLEQPGFLPAIGLRFTVGGWIIPRFGIAGTFRFQFNAGKGTLSNMMLGLRAMVQVTDPVAEGFHADVHLGTSYGQIQLRPPQGQGVNEPYLISGLNSVQIGGTMGYRVARNFGIHFTPEVHLLFPTFLFAFDLNIGVGVYF